MAEADLLEKAEALLRLAEGRGFGLLEYSEGPLQLRVAFAATGGAVPSEPAFAGTPPSALPGISPTGGEISQPPTPNPPISPLVGEMPGRAEGGVKPGTALQPAAATASPAVILSPGVGFFRRSHPAGGDLAGEGDDVAAGTVVALIQAGPLLQPVTAPRAGRLGRMLLAEGGRVGFGTALFEFSQPSA